MKNSIILVCTIAFWNILNIGFNSMIYEEVKDISEESTQEYDYSLDLRTDSHGCGFIEVRRDSCLFIIHPDSLEEFIIKDNL